MPELPEVETIKRDLQKRLIGLSVTAVDVYDARVLKGITKQDFQKKMAGLIFASVVRRGKMVIFTFTDKNLIFTVQPKMTGQLIYGDHLRRQSKLKDTKVVFHLSDGQYLNYNDQRLFGRLMLVRDLADVPYVQSIGPEPFDKVVQPAWVCEQLKRRTIPIKTALMNQTFLAGIGNIYASEILFDSGIHPEKPSKLISKKEAGRLCLSTLSILNEAIRYRGSSMRNYRDSSGNKGQFMNRIKVYARDGEPCVQCDTPIVRTVQAGRSTFYCPVCQK